MKISDVFLAILTISIYTCQENLQAGAITKNGGGGFLRSILKNLWVE